MRGAEKSASLFLIMVTKVFQLLLLLSPICFGANINVDMFDMIFFRTGIIALFMASLIDKPKREMPQSISYLILSLLGLCLVNLFIHTFSPTVLMNFQNLFLATVGFYIVYCYLDTERNIKKFILIAGLINLVFFISQRLGFDPIFDKKVWQEDGGFLGNKQRMMTYFALITPFLNLWLLIGAVVLGLYTKQYVIFIPVFIVLFMRTKNRREKIGLGIIGLLSIIALRNHIWYSLTYRFNTAWKPTLDLFFDRPLIGYGLGERPIKDLEVLGNSYLQFIMGVGILGAVWFGWVFKKLWKAIISDVSIISLALIMVIEYPIEILRLWYLVIAIIVMFLIKTERGKI